MIGIKYLAIFYLFPVIFQRDFTAITYFPELTIIDKNGDGDIAGTEVKVGHHVGADDFSTS